MNNVNLIGNIATQIELRYTDAGKPWCSFNLGYTRLKNNGKQSCFVGIVCFGALAENIAKYCAKGRQIAVTGELEVINDKRQDGTYNMQTRIICSHVDFLSEGKKS